MGIEIQQVIEDTPWQLRQLYYTLAYMQIHINTLELIQHALAVCVKWALAVGSLSVSLPGAVGSVAICSLIICFRRDLGLGHQMVSPIPQYADAHALLYTDLSFLLNRQLLACVWRVME